MPSSREVREGKKSAKGLGYLIAKKLEEAQPRVEHGATADFAGCNGKVEHPKTCRELPK